MKHVKGILLCFLSVVFLLFGCEDNQPIETTTNMVAEPLPKTIHDIVNYPTGKFASREYQISRPRILREIESLPPLREDATSQQLKVYFASVYSIFKLNYPDPKMEMKEYKVNLSMEGYIPSEIKYQQQYNIEIILDSSGSMANKMGSKTRMELAKESIQKFITSLPEGVNVSLRVYGHKGTSSEKDQSLSCSSNELVYPLQSYDNTSFNQSLHSFKPAGWTPLAQAMLEALKDFEKVDNSNSLNVIYIVSDGIETCGGNPVKAAQILKDSGLAPVINIIGFDLDNEGQSQLKEVAEAADGSYVNIQKQEELQKEFARAREELMKWEYWLEKSMDDLLHFKNQQNTLIGNMKNEWDALKVKENYHVQFSLELLESTNGITSQQEDQLNQIRKDHYKLQDEEIQNYLSQLEGMNEESYQKNLQKIYDIYRKNASN